MLFRVKLLSQHFTLFVLFLKRRKMYFVLWRYFPALFLHRFSLVRAESYTWLRIKTMMYTTTMLKVTM